MNWREKLPVSILIVIVAAVCIFLAVQCIFPPETGKGEKAAISDIDYLRTNIDTVLNSIADSTQSASEKLSSADSMSSPEVQPILDELWSGSLYALSYATITPDGKITAVAPEKYSGSVGINITGSEPADTIIQTKKPFLSDAFVAKEGFTGIEIAWPVFSGDGEYKGSILAMAEPSEFIGEIIGPIEDEKGFTTTVMQPDGFILYDKDEDQVGKNLFEDEPFTNYTSLQMLGKTIAARDAGSGAYTFYKSPENTGETTNKLAYWDTLEFMGKEWRIIIFMEDIAV